MFTVMSGYSSRKSPRIGDNRVTPKSVATLIRLAVSSAHAQGATRFLAHVQAQNVPLFQKLHWQALGGETIHGRAHERMQADLAMYPPCRDPWAGFVTTASAATA